MRDHHEQIDDIRRLDPIDGERLAASWADSEAKRALFEEIAAEQVLTVTPVRPAQPRAIRRVIALAASLVVVALVLVLVSGVLPRTSTPAFGFRQLPNGTIVVSDTADLRDPSALEAKLREFGVDVNVVSLPVSPSLVGIAQAFGPSPMGPDENGDYTSPPGISYGAPGSPDALTMTIDPMVFHGPVTIELYVRALPGEQYQVSQSVFDPGEVLGGLQCALGEPLRAADMASRLPALGSTPVWYVVSPTADPSITQETRVGTVPQGVILSGYALNDSTVEFRVGLDGVTLPPGAQERLSDVPCTAALAAPWR